MFVVRIPQMAIGDMRVDLRRRDIAVTQQRLDRTRVSAVLQQMRGETVAQCMRRDILHPGLVCITLNQGPGKLSCDWLTAIKEQVR